MFTGHRCFENQEPGSPCYSNKQLEKWIFWWSWNMVFQHVSIITLRNRRTFQLSDHHDSQLNEISLLVLPLTIASGFWWWKWANRFGGGRSNTFSFQEEGWALEKKHISEASAPSWVALSAMYSMMKKNQTILESFFIIFFLCRMHKAASSIEMPPSRVLRLKIL